MEDATTDTLYQAALLPKFVAAIGAMRLVEAGTLKLNEDANAKLTSCGTCRAMNSTRRTRSLCADCSA
jgi:CubicO group peptidase (beta-lactamase class C family)